MMLKKSSRSNLALFCAQFALSLMQVTFLFYYVKVFLNIFHVNEYWFNVAQFLFMFWNAINDPLFGYIQDVGESWMKNRLHIFTCFGPLMSLSFLILWFPWTNEISEPNQNYIEGIHLIVALFLYDAFFSYVGVAWCALFTESTRCHSERVKSLKYSQLATLSSCLIFVFIEKFSHSLNNFRVFQGICIGISVLSTLCFLITGMCVNAFSKTIIFYSQLDDSKEKLKSDSNDKDNVKDDNKKPLKYSWAEILKLLKELLFVKNFLRVVFTNFIHTARSVLHLNFASIIVDLLIPQNILAKGSWQLGAFFAFCTALPQVLVVLNERLIVDYGAQQLFIWSFYVSILASISLYLFSSSSLAIMIFFVIDSITVHSSAPLFNILLAEVVEDDTLRNKRSRSLSSLVFSLNAFIVKPAVSIAPVVIVFFLNRSGYKLYRIKNIHSESLVDCALNMTFCAPILLSLLEYFTLRNYSLHFTHKDTKFNAILQKL